MALVLSDFRIRFPEFLNVADTLVEAKLAEALHAVNDSVWGDEADTGQGLMAAHLLSVAPGGVQARLASDKAATTYARQYRDMVDRLTCGLRVF